jgi:hypothetical protein
MVTLTIETTALQKSLRRRANRKGFLKKFLCGSYAAVVTNTQVKTHEYEGGYDNPKGFLLSSSFLSLDP